MNPFASLIHSRKAILVGIGLVAVVAIFIAGAALHVETAQTATVIGSITALLWALVNGIAKEDAAAKQAPSAVGTMNVTQSPPAMPGTPAVVVPPMPPFGGAPVDSLSPMHFDNTRPPR